jgi:hypothetical protein
MLRSITITILLGLAVCACGHTGAGTATSPELNSGVTSSNGGGVRQTGGLNTQSIGPAGAQPTSANSKGSSY